MNLNFSLYRFVTEEEQAIFKQLIGDAFETEALLVSTLETESYTEYIFIYNHPTEEMNNLVSFYGKVKKKKSKELELLEFATAQLTEKMILRNLKELKTIKEQSLEESVASSIQHIAAQLLHNQPFRKNTNGEYISSYAAALKIKGETDKKYFLTCKHNCNGLDSKIFKEGYKLIDTSIKYDLAIVEPESELLSKHQNSYNMGNDTDCENADTVGHTIIPSSINCETKAYTCSSLGHSGSGIIKQTDSFLGVHQGDNSRVLPSEVNAYFEDIKNTISIDLELW